MGSWARSLVVVQTVGKGSVAERDGLSSLHLSDNSRCPAARRLFFVIATDGSHSRKGPPILLPD